MRLDKTNELIVEHREEIDNSTYNTYTTQIMDILIDGDLDKAIDYCKQLQDTLKDEGETDEQIQDNN